MSDESTVPDEPPRQGLTYFRVLELSHGLKDGSPIVITDDELQELFRAWLRLTDIDPHWQRGFDA